MSISADSLTANIAVPGLHLNALYRSDLRAASEHAPRLADADQQRAIELARALSQQVIYVPAERDIALSLSSDDYATHEERRFSGRDAIRIIANWQLRGERSLIENAERFLSSVLAAQVRLRTTLDPSLEVSIDGKWRDIRQLGSGVTHLVVIAVAIQRVRDPILLLEEPELSLHPRLQRRLIVALQEFVHQTIITTHSNHILDSRGAEIRLFRVSREGPHSRVHLIGANVLEALRDIGARPGSLSEANAVIWVEGPSDAIYIRHWLSELSEMNHLVEGIDYVFAFHAGALLKHSTEDREDASLSVFGEINPNYFVVVDRDPDENGGPSHAYTRGWLNHPRAWVTEPKEIEGYISDVGLKQGRTTINSTPSDTSKALKKRLEHLQLPISWSEHKVDLALGVVEFSKAAPDCWDLTHRAHLDASLRRIASFLRACRADETIQAAEIA